MPNRTTRETARRCVACRSAGVADGAALCRACEAERYASPIVYQRGIERRQRSDRRRRSVRVAVDRRELDRRGFWALIAGSASPDDPIV